MKSEGGGAQLKAVKAIVAAVFLLGRVPAAGQHMDLALSAEHIGQPCATSGKVPQPLSKLPPPRPEREDQLKGDPQKSLALWMQITELRIKHKKRWSAWEKGFQQVPPRDPHNPSKGCADRLHKTSLIYAELAGIHEQYAGDLKALETRGADMELVVLTTAAADLAQRTSDACKKFSAALASHSDDQAAKAEARLKKLLKARAELRTAFDLLRVKLSRKYDLHFPTLESMRKKAS